MYVVRAIRSKNQTVCKM